MFNNRTAEIEVIFPKKLDKDSESYFETSFISSSVYGFHIPKETAAVTDYTWYATANDDKSLQVYAVRTEKESKDAYFVLTNRDASVFLTSSVYENIYDNTKWNLGIRTYYSKSDQYNFISGSDTTSIIVELYGCNVELGVVKNEFTLSSEIANTGNNPRYIKAPRRYYIGAHRENFTGSVQQYSDLKVSSLRHWEKLLSNDEITSHARDVENYGVEEPLGSVNLYDTDLRGSKISEADTLSLHWNFDDVTGSNSTGEFLVNDFSSGSVSKVSRYPSGFGKSVGNQHTGRGYFFENNATSSVSVEYVQSSKQSLPEVLTSYDMTNIAEFDDEVFEKDSRAINHFFAIEKSMYQTISEEMMNMFSTISSFNNLVGQPVNKYRQEYKDLSKLRQLFYEKVQNEPDLDKYVDFYKWLDSSISILLKQFVPASTNISDDIRTMVESHVLERNKYHYKYPSVTNKQDIAVGGIKGINELQKSIPNWTYAFAPLNQNQSDNTVWWDVAESYTTALSQSAPGVNQSRQEIINSKKGARKRADSTPYKIAASLDQANAVEKSNINKKEVYGGINFTNNKDTKFYKSLIKFNSSSGMTINNIRGNANYYINDVLNPGEKDYALSDETTVGLKGKMAFPGNILLGTGSGYNASFNTLGPSGIQVTNLHSDAYLKGGETPIQGPFTEKNVGGYAHRHLAINSGSDNIQNRMEDWVVSSSSTSFVFTHPTVNSPRDFVTRDGMAKRPLNIKNIASNASNTLGNYTNIREVVSVTGREGNNKQFIVNNGFPATSSASTYISGAFDRPKIEFSSSNHTISERFSAPGGPETSYNFSDVETSQYSPYNALPYRNPVVRTQYNIFLKNSANQFGYASGSTVNSSDYSGTGSYHKVNRNTQKRIQYSGDTLVTGSKKDNGFVTHAIPRSDLQYSWISSSYISAFTLGYTPTNFEYSNSSGIQPAISFVSASVFALSNGMVQDFAGMNKLVVDAINTSSQTLGDSDQASAYVLGSYGTYSTASALQALLSRRGAQRGFNTWTQIQGNNNPIARTLRENHILSIIREDGQTYSADSVAMPAQRFGNIAQFRESPVITKYKPIVQSIGDVKYISSYGNNVSHFSNKEINDNFAPTPGIQIYDNVKSLYDELNYVEYGETIYPAEQNVFDNRIRIRPEYSINYWHSDRQTRNSRKANKISFGERGIYSIWGLDAPSGFLTASIPDATTDLNDPPGELLNSKTQVHNSYKAYITASALYALPHMMASSASVVAPSGITIPETGSVVATSPNIFGNIKVGAGNAVWDAGRLAGHIEDGVFVSSSTNRMVPAYDTYEAYAEELRVHNKDYSIVPEFRISDNIDFYIKNNNRNFLANNSKIFKIFGSSASVGNPTDSSYDDFYNVYSTSDFLKYFDIIKTEHNGIAAEKGLSLKCKALMKFLPYDGFYPAERTLQMAKQFSSSYAKYVNYAGADKTYENAKIRPFLEPVFAPGIVYNSIKSGISVAYPVLTSSYGVQTLGDYRTINTGSGGVKTFEYIPFEAAIEPNRYLRNKSLVDLQPHPSAALNVTASWDGRGDILYTMMANNFFGEVPEFFLPKGKISSIQSLPESDPNFGNVVQNRAGSLYYGMRIKIFRSLNLPRSSSSEYDVPQDNPTQTDLKETFTMYSRPSAFFHAVTGRQTLSNPQHDSTTYSDRVMDSISGYNWAGTPPYYHGEAWVDYIFKPSQSSKYTIQQIIDEITGVVSRRFDFNDPSSNDTGFYDGDQLDGLKVATSISGTPVISITRRTAMDLLDSFIIDGASTIKSVEYDAVTGAPLVVKDDPTAAQKILVIQPKWETPMFDFGDTGVRPITSASTNLLIPTNGSESVPRGMWHQFGLPPDSPEKGIFFQVTDIPKDWASKHPDAAYYNNGNLLSMAELMGIPTDPKRLGEVSEKKVVREAIIAVPFIKEGNRKKFFNIDKKLFEDAMNNKLDKDNSIQDMVSKLKNYVLPPRMDFITNKNIKPFSMYVFEFEHEFDKDDLVHIWQNLPPKSIDRVEEKEVTISHPLLVDELLGKEQLPSEVRWMVFKVKMKAVKNYFSKVPKGGNKLEDQKYTFQFEVGGNKQELNYSYNWPYDFFSIVEMAKIDADVILSGDGK